MKVRVADYIANRLREYNVRTIFMLNGGGMMHLVDAVGRCKQLKYVCNHHEQASAMAADGYARLSGGIGVCYATSGPGGTNVLTGVVGAWQDSVPVLFLTGQSKSSQTIATSGIEGLRQYGTFEVDIVPIVKSVTKYAQMLTDPKSIRFHLEKAIHLATTGRPGPVLLDLPLDIQGALIDPEELDGFEGEYLPPSPSEAEISRVLLLLQQAKRPLLLVGSGVRAAGAADAFRLLVDRLNVPVVTTQLGKDILHYDHSMFVGHPGPKGDRPGNFAIQTADLIVSIGCSLHGQTTGWESKLFAPNAIKVQVDLDPSLFQREQVNVDVKILADAGEFISLLLERGMEHGCNAWRECCQFWKKRYPVNKEAHQQEDGRINFYDFIDTLSNVLDSKACIVSDAGSAFYVTGQALRIKEGQRFISSGSLGSMGFALPAANGAAIADPSRTIVCITGDGSLMTNIHDLATTRQNNLNLKLFIINNDGYVSMRNTQREFFGGLLIGADGTSGVFIPDLSELAACYKLPYVLCDGKQDLDSVIESVLNIPGPVLCDIRAMINQKIIPSVASKKLPDGRMLSTALHDMSPNLSDDVLGQELNRAVE